MVKLFERYPNLHTDLSWDVLPKTLLMNYNAKVNVSRYGKNAITLIKSTEVVKKLLFRFSAANHEDLDTDAAHLFNMTAVAEVRKEVK